MTRELKLKVSAGTVPVQKLVITGHPNIDAVCVYLEDHCGAHSKTSYAGNLILTVDGLAYTHYWGFMGNRTLREFLVFVSARYITQMLAGDMPSMLPDPDALSGVLQDEIVKMRRNFDLSKDDARDLYGRAARVEDPFDDCDLMERMLGEDWHGLLPEKPNPRYETLRMAVECMQAVLFAETTANTEGTTA